MGGLESHPGSIAGIWNYHFNGVGTQPPRQLERQTVDLIAQASDLFILGVHTMHEQCCVDQMANLSDPIYEILMAQASVLFTLGGHTMDKNAVLCGKSV